jgi:hypothetical protein
MSVVVGDRLGKLTILSIDILPYVSKSGRKYNRKFVNCQCDCGNLCRRELTNIKQCNINNTACGCNRGKLKWGAGRSKPSYYREGRYFNQQYLRYVSRNAIKGKHKFSLIIDDLDNQYEAQDGLCYYTGDRLILPPKAVAFHYSKDYNISVDRKDSKLGYTKDNIVLCTSDANLAKQSLSIDDFISLCRRVAARHAPGLD